MKKVQKIKGNMIKKEQNQTKREVRHEEEIKFFNKLVYKRHNQFSAMKLKSKSLVDYLIKMKNKNHAYYRAWHVTFNF